MENNKKGQPRASLMAQLVKNPPATQETQEMQVQSLGREDLLEKEMATHSSVLAWRIPGTGEPHGLPSMGSHRVGHDWSDLAAAAAGIPRASLVAQMVKHLPAMQETRFDHWVRRIPWKKQVATHSSTLAWRIPWMEEPGGLQSMGLQRVRHDWATPLWLWLLRLSREFHQQSLIPNMGESMNVNRYMYIQN